MRKRKLTEFQRMYSKIRGWEYIEVVKTICTSNIKEFDKDILLNNIFETIANDAYLECQDIMAQMIPISCDKCDLKDRP